MIIDLTFTASEKNIFTPGCIAEYVEKELPLKSANTSYTGLIYDLSLSSMAGSYIDFPGHIKETDNGENAENYSVERLYRRDATVVHLNRESNSGGVTAEDLQIACSSSKSSWWKAF